MGRACVEMIGRQEKVRHEDQRTEETQTPCSFTSQIAWLLHNQRFADKAVY
jgi:hypothetical protein